MKIRKTKKMIDAEARFGRPLESVLPALITDEGLTGAAAIIGISKASMGYWMLKLGIQTHHIAIGPGERITVHRSDGREVIS